MKCVIPGGSGQLGTILSRSLVHDGHQVVVLTRAAARPAESTNLRFLQWDAKSQEHWTKSLKDSDVVINLAGRSVNCRYNLVERKSTTQPGEVHLRLDTDLRHPIHRFVANRDESSKVELAC